jgi:hypothetical protein
MSHSTVIFLKILKLIFIGTAVVFSLLATRESLRQQHLLKQLGCPGRSSRKSARIVQRYFFHTLLLLIGASVCDLVLPHNSFDSIFHGIMCFLFLGMAAVLFELIRIGRWNRRKYSGAQPAG